LIEWALSLSHLCSTALEEVIRGCPHCQATVPPSSQCTSLCSCVQIHSSVWNNNNSNVPHNVPHNVTPLWVYLTMYLTIHSSEWNNNNNNVLHYVLVSRYTPLSETVTTMSEFTRSVLVLRLSWKCIDRGVKNLKLSNLGLNRSM